RQQARRRYGRADRSARDLSDGARHHPTDRDQRVGGGPVVARTVSVVGKIAWWSGEGSSSTNCTAASAMSSIGWWTVVSGGAVYPAIGVSSKPTIETCPGTSTPSAWAAERAPTAT